MRFDEATLLARLGQAVVATDGDGVVGFWNPAAEELYGWPAEEILGADVAAVLVPCLPEEAREELRSTLAQGRTWTGWYLARRRDGSTVPVVAVQTGVRDGSTLVGVVSVSTGIGVGLRPLLERLSDASLFLGSDAVVRYASPSVRHLAGGLQEDLVGVPVTQLVHPEDRAVLLALFDRMLSAPGTEPVVEIRVRGARGWVWCEVTVTNLLDDPALGGVVCHLRPSLQRAAREEAEARSAQLQTALTSRLVIEQAKGYVAGRDKVDTQVAFERIRRHARSNNLPLREVCAQILDEDLQLGA